MLLSSRLCLLEPYDVTILWHTLGMTYVVPAVTGERVNDERAHDDCAGPEPSPYTCAQLAFWPPLLPISPLFPSRMFPPLRSPSPGLVSCQNTNVLEAIVPTHFDIHLLLVDLDVCSHESS